MRGSMSRSGTNLVWTWMRESASSPRRSAVARAERADQLLDAGIDVGAVEGGDAGVGEGDHVAHRIVAHRLAVAGGKLPAAADDARNLVAGGKRMRCTRVRSFGKRNGGRLGVAEASRARCA